MKLQFTNGYRPRFDQISRILIFILDTQKGGRKISQVDIVAALGIPKNQVENLISMMIGFGMVQPRTNLLTTFGQAIICRDPYFEKIETLWMIHYIVSSNPEWIVWYRIINSILPSQGRFEVDAVSEQYFSDLSIHFSTKTISEKLPKEVGAVFSSYTRTELSRLNIMTLEGTGNFILSTPVNLPSSAFMFCLIHFRDRFSPGSTALNIVDICQKESSPGRVFMLQEYQVRDILGDLHSAGLIRLEKFANLDQVRFLSTITQGDIFERIYGSMDDDECL